LEGTVRTLTITLSLLLIAGIVFAQRPKPVVDPETKDGLLIEHIQQETDPVEKLRFLEQFAAQYPAHSAVGWVYDQLQPLYLSLKDWDKAMHIGTLRLALEPENLEAGKIALRAAEAKHDPKDVANWADRVWHVGAAVAGKGGATAADARATQSYAEFCLFSTAEQTPDLHARLQLLKALDERMPSNQYSPKLPAEYFRIYREIGPEDEAMETAEKLMRTEPDNVDAIMYLANHYFRKDAPKEREKVIALTGKAIEILEKKPRPEAESESDWGAKKTQMLGTAYYMGGVSSSLNGLFPKSDLMLRAALPYVKDPAIEAVVLYHLGLANYRLADKGGPSRSMDALRFMRRCAAIRSPFQEQAVRNIENIKAEYNLK
jgi:tetratricopeptide (TPR) repeat protein